MRRRALLYARKYHLLNKTVVPQKQAIQTQFREKVEPNKQQKTDNMWVVASVSCNRREKKSFFCVTFKPETHTKSKLAQIEHDNSSTVSVCVCVSAKMLLNDDGRKKKLKWVGQVCAEYKN